MKKVRWNLFVRDGRFLLTRKGIHLYCDRIRATKDTIFIDNNGLSYSDMGKWKHSIYCKGIKII